MIKNIDAEMKLETMDFSRFSKVKDSLKARLMDRFEDSSMNSGISSIITELSDDDLDMVVAAGTGMPKKDDDPKKFF